MISSAALPVWLFSSASKPVTEEASDRFSLLISLNSAAAALFHVQFILPHADLLLCESVRARVCVHTKSHFYLFHILASFHFCATKAHIAAYFISHPGYCSHAHAASVFCAAVLLYAEIVYFSVVMDEQNITHGASRLLNILKYEKASTPRNRAIHFKVGRWKIEKKQPKNP